MKVNWTYEAMEQNLTTMFFIAFEEFIVTSNDIPKGAFEKDLIFLTDKERTFFFSIFLIILTVAIVGNVASIICTIKKKHRFIQKVSVMSLASGDLIMAVAYSINNLETFSHPLINWTMGDFLCSLIPFLQIFGLLTSTFAIVAIALDRYHNVMNITIKKWNPSKKYCMAILGITIFICMCISSPVYNMFNLETAIVVSFNQPQKLPTRKYLQFCISLVKHDLMIYNICIAVLIFSSLFVIFLWSYLNIAKLVWEHRKPPEVKLQNKNQELSMDTSTTVTRVGENKNPVNILINAKNKLHVERKMRTFKIIILLMMVFFVCRLPFWIFNIVKLIGTYKQHKHWIMTYVFNAMALLNCALNPFLYTFLNPTLAFFVKLREGINDFVCKVCCCCCSNADFEEYEKDNYFESCSYRNNGSNITRGPRTRKELGKY